LQQSLLTYDSLGERTAAYEQEIQQRLQRLTPPGRKAAEAPPLASRNKHRMMKQRHQEDKRQALFRMAGVDLTTIDGIGVETAAVILSEYGVELSKFPAESQFVSHVKLAPHRPVSGGKVLRKKRKMKGTRAAQGLLILLMSCTRPGFAIGVIRSMAQKLK
jgi:transposase